MTMQVIAAHLHAAATSSAYSTAMPMCFYFIMFFVGSLRECEGGRKKE